jgi:hypothetical protein
MLLLHGLNQTAATTVVQTNVTQFIHGQQQQSTSVFYLTLSPQEKKTKIQTKINLLNVTYDNKSTSMTDISTLITYSLSFNQIQSCNSNSSYSTPPTHQDIQQTVPNSPTNVHNHVPGSVKPIQLHSLHTKEQPSASISSLLKLQKTTNIILQSTMIKTNDLAIALTVADFQELYETQQITNNLILKQSLVAWRLQALSQHACLTVFKSYSPPYTIYAVYLLILIFLSIVFTKK